MTTNTANIVECKDCVYGREANVPNAVFCMLNHQTFPIPVYGCNNGRPGRIVPQTKADRIRAMTDEELAEWIDHIQADAYERGMMETPVVDYPNIYSEWLSWLKSPEVDNG